MFLNDCMPLDRKTTVLNNSIEVLCQGASSSPSLTPVQVCLIYQTLMSLGFLLLNSIIISGQKNANACCLYTLIITQTCTVYSKYK